MTPADELSFEEFWRNMDSNLFLALARHLSHQDLKTIALCSVTLHQRVHHFLANPNVRKWIASPEAFIGIDTFHVRTRNSFLELYPATIHDLMVTANGEWLFVLHTRDAPVSLSIFKQISSKSLEYREVKHGPCPLPAAILPPHIIGLDHSPKNPGVVFWDRGNQQLLTRHLKDKNSPALKAIPLPGNFTAVAVHARSGLWRVCVMETTDDGEIVKQFEMSPNGKVTSEPQILTLKAGINWRAPFNCQIAKGLSYSPSGTCVAVVNARGRELLVIDSQTFRVERGLYIAAHVGDALSPLSLSITDNGCSLFVNGRIVETEKDHSKQKRRWYYLTLTNSRPMTHLGNGKLILSVHAERSWMVEPIFTRQKYPERLLEYLRERSPHDYDKCRDRNGLDIFENDRRCLRYDKIATSQFFNRNMSRVGCQYDWLPTIRTLGPLDQATLSDLYWSEKNYYSHTHGVHNLLLLADMLRFETMLYLAAELPEVVSPELTGLLALARSPQVQALFSIQRGSKRRAVEEWFKHPFTIETETIGRIHSSKFFFGTPKEITALVLAEVFELIRHPFSTRVLGSDFVHYPTDPLCFLDMKLTDNTKAVDHLCASRHPHWDRAAKKLIPKHFGILIKREACLRNYITLDALLRKLILQIPKSQERSKLDAARQRMLTAVRANPSLSYDADQLLNTRFYGKDSVISCLKNEKYRDEIVDHFLKEHDLDHQLKDDARPSGGCGL